MFQELEVVTLLVGLTGLVFCLSSAKELRRIPAAGILVAGLCVSAVGWVMTVAEGVLWPTALNLIEHVCYLGSTLLAILWLWRALHAEEGSR